VIEATAEELAAAQAAVAEEEDPRIIAHVEAERARAAAEVETRAAEERKAELTARLAEVRSQRRQLRTDAQPVLDSLCSFLQALAEVAAIEEELARRLGIVDVQRFAVAEGNAVMNQLRTADPTLRSGIGAQAHTMRLDELP
jgi:uncharacterized protein YyaL (SSP411 family)